MTFQEPIRPPDTADALLMDVARRVQLSPTKHSEADQHYHALCNYADRPESPLHGLVITCYPSGSFATGTAIASRVSQDQHDVDVVIELDISPQSDPKVVLTTLFTAIKGEKGSRYHDRVTLNSRCVTVTYDDRTRVDLMPIARLRDQPDKAGHLFHARPDQDEYFHKPVNPWAFANRFNAEVAYDPVFRSIFDARRRLADGILAKADADPLPEHAPLTEKSARVVALQLLKRNRDVRYRARDGRKPPSVVLSALALEIAPAGAGLTDEVLNIARHIAGKLRENIRLLTVLDVRNPAYTPDIFTDRWPKNVSAQHVYLRDLEHLQRQLGRLRADSLTLTEMRTILDDLFGETAASFAVERFLDASQREVERGTMRFGQTGRVLTGGGCYRRRREQHDRAHQHQYGGAVASGLIPIETQIAAMAARWSNFAVIDQSDRSAVWEGHLQPVQKRYLVRIRYQVPYAIEAFSLLAVQPRVQVLDPILERHPAYEQGPIPHVYLNRIEPDLPFLCLFDPYRGEWTPSDLLADTTVPWTARNLFFYEGWLVTRRWRGGGRHPTQEERNGVDPTSKTITAI